MEDALAGVKAYYQAELGDALSAIETARSVTIPRQKLMETAPIDDRQYPMIEILPQRQTYEYGSPEAPLTEEIADFSLLVAISHAGNLKSAVQAVLMRYVEAIVAITFDDDTYGNRFLWVKVAEAEYSDVTEPQESGHAEQRVAITLAVRVA
jgi:hypothetical protein